MSKGFDKTMTTDSTYQPNKAYAWGAAAQINMLVDANDAELWDTFFRFLRERNCLDELAERINLEREALPPEAAE